VSSINIYWKIPNRKSSLVHLVSNSTFLFNLEIKSKLIALAFSSLFKPTTRCQMSTSILGWAQLISAVKYPNEKVSAQLGLIQKHFPGIKLYYLPGWDYASQVHNRATNVSFDIGMWAQSISPVKRQVWPIQFYTPTTIKPVW
jgi:hypothetical protein